MRLAELPGRLSRLQQTFRFKVIASIVAAVLAIGGFSAWWVIQHDPARPGADIAVAQEAPEGAAESPPVAPRIDPETLQHLLGSREATGAVALGFGVALGLSLVVIWLGVALTYLALLLAGAFVAAPLLMFESTRGLGQVVAGVIALAASLAILLQAARMALSSPTPVIAVARNVLNEAVRMKISAVFIVLLILLLAGLPGFLDEEQPLRYRVQSFLQYGVSGAFWTLAIMTLFFSAASVAFEQRDRVIWQTMSKPVRPYEYLLGKWLGVMVLNAVLLSVSATGLFLFTEHLRNQRAQGEVQPWVNEDGSGAPTTDRLLLHTQVLVSRIGIEPEVPDPPIEQIRQAVDRIVADAVARDASFTDDERRVEQFRLETAAQQIEEWRRRTRTVDPGPVPGRFLFTGLKQAKQERRPLTLRYKVQSGSNDPTDLYRVTFFIGGLEFPRQVILGTAQTISFPPEAIDEQGNLEVEVYNADIYTRQANPIGIRFEPGDLEVLYAVGGFELNFLRVMLVLWLKLGFFAAVAIFGATFLSFPVACMLSFLILFAAETAGFLQYSLNEYPFFTPEGKFDAVGAFFRIGAGPVAWAFQAYARLKPTANLVDGRLVPWADAIRALLILGAWTTVILAGAWAIFRRRELATYSGH